MGLFDFLDSRKSCAKNLAKKYTEVLQLRPHFSAQEIIEVVIQARYSIIGPNPHQAEIFYTRRHEATDIFSLCHLIAEVELLSHLTASDRITMQMGGENIVQHTYDVMDNELVKLGFQRPRA